MKKVLIIVSLFFLLLSCSSEDDRVINLEGNSQVGDGEDPNKDNVVNIEDTLKEAEESKGVIDESIEIIDSYGDTINDTIDDTRSVVDMINNRNEDLENL